MSKMCACGRPLHYSDPKIREDVEELIEDLGEYIKVSREGRTWLIPRHYIALHRFKAIDLGTDALPPFKEIHRNEYPGLEHEFMQRR